MNRQVNDAYGFYLIDESKLITFLQFRKALLNNQFEPVSQTLFEMADVLLKNSTAIKCPHLLFTKITEKDRTDTANYLQRTTEKLGKEKLSLGEVRYILQFYFHYTCSVLNKDCWFAAPEINFSKEYIERALSQSAAFNEITSNPYSFDTLPLLEEDYMDEADNYYIISPEVSSQLLAEYETSWLFSDEATVYYELLKNAHGSNRIVIRA